MGPSRSKISFKALQSQIQKNSELQRTMKFWLTAQQPQAALPRNEWKLPFSFGAAARSKSNEAQMSAIHGQIEDACTIGTEQSKGDCGGIGVVRLHEDPAHAGASPIGLEKTRKRKQC
jgi:hypothetical protein